MTASHSPDEPRPQVPARPITAPDLAILAYGVLMALLIGAGVSAIWPI